MRCPFCIKERSRAISESTYTYVILSNPRLMKGHTLVIPKRHVERLSELSEIERKELIDKVIEMEEKILKEFSTGCDIRQHYRPFQKQSRIKISHLHIHLHPRELKDELYEKCQIFETKLFKNLTKVEQKEMSKLLA